MQTRRRSPAAVCLALFSAGLPCMGAITCATSPPLFRALYPETGAAFRPPEQSFLKKRQADQTGAAAPEPFPKSGVTYLRYGRGTRALFFAVHGPFRTELDLLETEDLLGVMDALQDDGGHRSLSRPPDLFPLRVRIENTTGSALRADLERVEIARVGGGPIACMKGEQYTTTFYSRAMFPLLFEWALEQKDEYRRLHPIPDYVLSAREPRSASNEEEQQALTASLGDAARRHVVRTQVAPFGSVEGICLFPLLLPGRYELRYARSTGAVNEALPFPPVRFVVRYETDTEGARPESGRPTAPETKAADEFVFERRRADGERRAWLLKELYTMHRQHHRHAELRRDREAKTKKDRKKLKPQPAADRKGTSP